MLGPYADCIMRRCLGETSKRDYTYSLVFNNASLKFTVSGKFVLGFEASGLIFNSSALSKACFAKFLNLVWRFLSVDFFSWENPYR